MPDLTVSQLECHLWEAANILRGPVDAADFKSYVFPLLFFKRLSDFHDDEHAAALAEYEGDEESALFPENYRFQIPEGCHWADVRKAAVNVGQALQTALRDIEQANPHTLYGIFGDAQWTNKDRPSDALLRDLIEHFSRLSLGNASAKADVQGQSYEYLIKKFADATNKKAREFYTPRLVVRLMVNILDPRERESIDDPTCRTGGILLEAIHHVAKTRGDVWTLWGKRYGQEKNLTTTAIARMNLFLNGSADSQIVRDDIDALVLDAKVLDSILKDANSDTKACEVQIKLIARLLHYAGNRKFTGLDERLEKVREGYEQGLLNSLEFSKAILKIAKDTVEAENQSAPEDEQDKALAAWPEAPQRGAVQADASYRRAHRRRHRWHRKAGALRSLAKHHPRRMRGPAGPQPLAAQMHAPHRPGTLRRGLRLYSAVLLKPPAILIT
jgi:hypothetical protein